ncbi:MAG: hypothetical protein LKF96_00755 [Treponema sp.]|jgi:hypothetical protein|nr:hypothetical protein [Treponema sp.]
MTDIQKFLSDSRRIVKQEYADYGERYDGIQASRKIMTLFVKNNQGLAELPESLADYWFTTFVSNSPDPANEPTEEHMEKIAALHSFLNNEEEETDSLDKKDWKEIARLVNFEAEALPIGTLSEMMSMLLSKKAL